MFIKISVIICCLLVFSCSVIKTGGQDYSVRDGQGCVFGFITDRVSQKPIEGVTVTSGGTLLKASTDSDGYYELLGLREDAYDIIYQCEGYETVTVEAHEMNVKERYQIDVALNAIINDGS